MASGLKILYLVHDLSDPAVHKRCAMLHDGGAEVTLGGFRRGAQPLMQIAGRPVIDFGRTYNANFLQRAAAVARECMAITRHAYAFAAADVIIARNLEMLAIGVRGRGLCRKPTPLVYECLDIHRLLLNSGPLGRMLRAFEAKLAKHASALLTSSPAFVTHYFAALSGVRLPVRLVENKLYPTPITQAAGRKAAPPWRIGWFGAIRCRKSLAILRTLAAESGGKIEVVIRGKASYDQFDDFDGIVKNAPGVSFFGPYKNPDDLAAIYGDVHFTWAIDMFEEAKNSAWLLPNRLYEGCAFGSVPIAAEAVETAKFLNERGIGVVLTEPKGKALADFFAGLTMEKYLGLTSAVSQLPGKTWVYDKQDCAELVAYLGGL